jgi:hypothetical protein
MERTAYGDERKNVSQGRVFDETLEYQNTMTVEVRGVSQSNRT